MPDIFGRSNNVYAGSFPVDGARMSVAGGDGQILGVGLLTQNLGYQYSQPITILYEVGTNNAYLVSGRARGGVNVSRVLGPRPVLTAFYSKYGDVCNAKTNVINLEARAPSCGDGTSTGNFVLGMNNVVITSMAGSVASENGLMTENLSMQYLSLELN